MNAQTQQHMESVEIELINSATTVLNLKNVDGGPPYNMTGKAACLRRVCVHVSCRVESFMVLADL